MIALHAEQDGFTTSVIDSEGRIHPWRIDKSVGARIVCAVNSHDVLVTALRTIQLNADALSNDEIEQIAKVALSQVQS